MSANRSVSVKRQMSMELLSRAMEVPTRTGDRAAVRVRGRAPVIQSFVFAILF